MARVLLTAVTSIAVSAFQALPAQAQTDSGGTIAGMRSHHSARPVRDNRNLGPCRADGERSGEEARVRCSALAGSWAYADGTWALYNNQSWGPDSFNDWWNDRPDRAYPRWVREQRRRGTCDPDRMWWSGAGWHC